MSTDDTTTIETIFSVQAIAFYVWVLGVAITATWKTAETDGWIKVAFKMVGYIIFAIVVAIAVVCWFGPNGVVALAVVFVVTCIVRIFQKFRKLFGRTNTNNRMTKTE